MCVVSMIGDHYHDKWKDWPWKQQGTGGLQPPSPLGPTNVSGVTRQEFDRLKQEVEEMKVLLKKAIEYDKKNNEPHCEVEEKLATLKKVAELFGVDLTDILK